MVIMNQCQSCGMPMGENTELYGSNADGSSNSEYCQYCFKEGQFTSEESMDDMIKTCVPFLIQDHPELSEETAKNMMQELLPKLKRWA